MGKSSVKYAYNHTLPGSLLRLYLVDVFAANATPRWRFFDEHEANYQDFPKSFTEELMIVMIRKIGGASPNFSYNPASYMHKVAK